ncbi:MAG: GNAT family N-acetyltransferase [Oscillospiraceae bacterium]|nr:GNAT family N-acetyltransferase [Oscillospiraceae bacterium]
MIIETKRLLLRPWQCSDAESLYLFAQDPRVGPIAGWPVHTDVENSRQIIQDVLSGAQTYAVTLQGDNRAIGSIGLMIGAESNLSLPERECEIGYWIGVPFWGCGYIPEAVIALLHLAFEQLSIEKVWCSYFDGNEQSKRVQEKCGFVYHHTNWDRDWPPLQGRRTEHVTCMTKSRWALQQAKA